MNILFLNSVPTHVFGGIEHWTGMVARGLLERGHRITIAGREGSEYIRRNRDIHPELDIREMAISGDFNPVTIAAIKKIIREKKTEVVIANFNKDIRLGGLAAALEGDVKVIWRAGLNQTRKNFVHRTLTPRLLDGVITPSHRLKEQIVGSGYIDPAIVKVIHTGIPDLPQSFDRQEAHHRLRQKYDLPADSCIAVTSGRFVDQKGHIHLVEAAPAIVQQFPTTRFLWLGSGPLEPMLIDRMKELGLREYFVLAGLLDDFTLELLGADIMLHPSVEEPFGIVLLEGMRAGLPIVASRVGGIPEVVADGETAILVDAADSDALGKATITLLGDGERRKTMGEAGRARWRQCFSYDTMLNELERHLRSVLAGDSGAL